MLAHSGLHLTGNQFADVSSIKIMVLSSHKSAYCKEKGILKHGVSFCYATENLQ